MQIVTQLGASVWSFLSGIGYLAAGPLSEFTCRFRCQPKHCCPDIFATPHDLPGQNALPTETRMLSRSRNVTLLAEIEVSP